MNSSVLQIIKNRRSIKKFLPKNVTKGLLRKVFEAAIWAPSAHNAQPWRFIVIARAELKQRLAYTMANEWLRDLVRDGVPPETRERLIKTSIEQFTEAPILIVACLTMEDMDKYPDVKRKRCEHIMATQSLAAAIQNMLLAAHFQGLGTCWFCAPLFCQDAVRSVLGIPEDVEPQALITLGYPSERPSPPPRKPLEDLVYMDRWSERL